MPINTLPIAPNPQYRRAAPLPTPELRQGRTISEAGQALGNYANRQEQLQQAYDDMVEKRKKAILAAQLDQQRMAETERSNLAQEEIAGKKAEFEKSKWEIEKEKAERETQIKEAEEARKDKQQAYIDKWAERVAAPPPPGQKNALSFEDAFGLGEAYGIAHTERFENYMKLKYPNQYRPPSSVNINLGRKDEASQAGYINNKLRSRRLSKERDLVRAMPIDMLRKYVTHPPKFSGMPSTKKLEEVPDTQLRNSLINLINAQMQEAERQATKNISEGRIIETDIPPDIQQNLEKGYQQIEREYQEKETEKMPEDRFEKIEWLLKKIKAMEADADTTGL